MLELRLTADAKRIAAMHKEIARECERSNAGAEHAATVAQVIEQLVDTPDACGGRGRRLRTAGDVFVIVTVQSDATMLIVRDTRPEPAGLGAHRQRILEAYTSSWSTMSGRDGRTVWAEVGRRPAREAASDPAAAATPRPAAEVRAAMPSGLRSAQVVTRV